MSAEKTVLITGVTGYWGARLVRRLETEPNYRVLAVDMARPETSFEYAQFVPADIRNPRLADLFRAEKVDTVCHLTFAAGTTHSEHAFEMDAIGVTEVVKACAQAGVRKLILMSSTMVYGARPDNPAFITERQAVRAASRYSYIRNLVEIENFVRDFNSQAVHQTVHQAVQMNVTVLRFAGILGPTARTPLTAWLREPVVPALLGFDPLMQVIHEDDVVEALAHAVAVEAAGVFNVAAEGVLPLAKVIRLAGRQPLPIFHPFAYGGLRLLGDAPVSLRRHIPLDLDYLRYPWVADLTRMGEVLGFTPRFTGEETVNAFAEELRLSPFRYAESALHQAEAQLRRAMDARRS